MGKETRMFQGEMECCFYTVAKHIPLLAIHMQDWTVIPESINKIHISPAYNSGTGHLRQCEQGFCQ